MAFWGVPDLADIERVSIAVGRSHVAIAGLLGPFGHGVVLLGDDDNRDDD